MTCNSKPWLYMPLVYIAGPFRAANAWDREANIRRAEELALAVWRSGAACLCPHTNTRFFEGAAPDDVWLKGDLEMLRRCDAMLMTPDYARSTGALNEETFAMRSGIPVFYSLDDLKPWLDAELALLAQGTYAS